MCSAWKSGAEHLIVYSPENPGCLVVTSMTSLKHRIMDGESEVRGPISSLLKCHLVIEIL